MSILVYNLTTAPLTLNNGVGGAPKLVIPASTSGEVGVKGLPWYGSGDEFEGLDLAAYTALQTQQLSGLVAFEWTQAPEYPTFPLYVAAAQLDVADLDVNLYVDPVTGLDTNPGTLALPLQTFEALMDAKPPIYMRALNFHLNIDPPSAVVNTTKKIYPLSNVALQFLFPEMEGKNAQTPYLIGGFTNELGDLTATAGTTISLTTNQNFTLDLYAGAVLNIVSGTGAGQERIIRGNTVGPNSIITPETTFTTAPDATSVYRIGYPNVEIQFKQNVLFCAPPQNLYMKGIRFKFTGTSNGRDFQVGNMVGTASGGTLIAFGCEFDLLSTDLVHKANFSVRGVARLETDGSSTYWCGPNNPFTPEDINLGCYFHGANILRCNAGGFWLGGSGLIKNCTNINVGSTSFFSWFQGTIDGTRMTASGGGSLDVSGVDPALRARVRRVTFAAAVTLSSVGRALGVAGTSFDLMEFSDITGNMMSVQDNSETTLGNITVGGVNIGFGLVVGTGGKARISPSTLLSGGVQLDGVPLTLAQALAAPFNGTLTSNVALPFQIIDPGTGVALPVLNAGNIALNIGAGAETNSLPAPSYVGETLTLSVAVAGGGSRVVTATAAINRAGNTIMTLINLRDSITLRGMKSGVSLVWQVINNDLATPLA